MVAAATATATATACVVAMQDRQDIPTQFNQVRFFEKSQHLEKLKNQKLLTIPLISLIDCKKKSWIFVKRSQ